MTLVRALEAIEQNRTESNTFRTFVSDRKLIVRVYVLVGEGVGAYFRGRPGWALEKVFDLSGICRLGGAWWDGRTTYAVFCDLQFMVLLSAISVQEFPADEHTSEERKEEHNEKRPNAHGDIAGRIDG